MERFHSIYSKTCQFVYLRAKSILVKEDDIQKLMKEVYLKAMEEGVNEERLYKWFGKQVYTLGCGKFRQKKVREADLIDLDKQKYLAQEDVDREKAKELICESLEDLPDMYQATLYAVYYDHMNLKEVSMVMGYSVGAIVNRLNYVHKYLERVLEDYQEEHGANVQFSVEIVCDALKEWSEKHQLAETVSQNIYAAICRELKIATEEIDSDEETAGVFNKISVVDDEVGAVCAELEAYSVKNKKNKKQLLLFAGLGILVALSIAGVLLFRSLGQKDNQNETQPPVEQEEDIDPDSQTNIKDEVETEDDVVDSEEAISDETSKTDDSYILPNSDKEKLTRADLEGLTKEQLRLARNEIYARHGMIFGVSDLDNYFATKTWYKPAISFADFDDKVEMSIVEEQNIILIQQVEKER